jgi:hypothetical protein
MMRKLKPVTPGELLLEEFLMPMGVSQYRLAKEIGVPAQLNVQPSLGVSQGKTEAEAQANVQDAIKQCL